MLPVYDPAANCPPAQLLPTLSINEEGKVRLHKSMLCSLPLRHGQHIDLIPPANGSRYWHLDLRPEAARRLRFSGGQARIAGVLIPSGLLAPYEVVTLCLLPGDPFTPHYYPLLPISELTHAFSSFLETAAVAARTPQA